MTARINGSFVLAVSICAVCIAFLLAMTNYYGIQPPERLSPLFEPQRWFIITGTIGVFLFVVVSVLSSDYAISRTIKTVGIYSMVIYVQHTIWGSGIRSLLVKTGLNDITALVFLILFGSLLLPIAWQKISDRLGITRYFGIRPAE